MIVKAVYHAFALNASFGCQIAAALPGYGIRQEEPAGLAARLETAGDAEDADTVYSRTGKLLVMYRRLDEFFDNKL